MLSREKVINNNLNNSPGALEFDPEKNSTKLIFSGYLQNINRKKMSKVPKFPNCAKFVTAIIQNGRVFFHKMIILFHLTSNYTVYFASVMIYFAHKYKYTIF